MEIEKRKHNLVPWGLNESISDKVNSDGAKGKDTEAVKELLKVGLKVDAERRVLEVHRIDKFLQGKVRPVQVKIQAPEGRIEVMSRAKTLRDNDNERLHSLSLK